MPRCRHTHTVDENLDRLHNYLRVINQEMAQDHPDMAVVRALGKKSLTATLSALSARRLTAAANRRQPGALGVDLVEVATGMTDAQDGPAAGSVHPMFARFLRPFQQGA